MRFGPKDTEERLRKMTNAWEELASTKTFGVTLEAFKTGVKPSFDIRERIADLEDQLAKAKDDRDRCDETSLALSQRVVDSIIADGTEGRDSSLLAACGRVRLSERKSGLHRRKAVIAAPQ